MAVIISHSHFIHVEFVSSLVFQTFDRIIFGKLSFLGTRYAVTVQDPHRVPTHFQKTFSYCSNTFSILN